VDEDGLARDVFLAVGPCLVGGKLVLDGWGGKEGGRDRYMWRSLAGRRSRLLVSLIRCSGLV
jgi:hypothetical protein